MIAGNLTAGSPLEAELARLADVGNGPATAQQCFGWDATYFETITTH